MNRVFIIGHRGMLGHTVAAYLTAEGHEVITNDARYLGEPLDPLLREVRESDCDWVVNALGAIPQKGSDTAAFMRANAFFPPHLVHEMADHQRLIHASTDCVFSGRRGHYRTGERPDDEEPYGRSKAIGETAALDERVICLRTSVIGPSLPGGAGLLKWFLDQEGPVQGYTNHIWNGITTLEWAKAAGEIIRGTAPFQNGIVQLGFEPPLSKFELLKQFASVWRKSIEITPTHTDPGVDRSLIPDWTRAPIRQQLQELEAWMNC